MFVQSGSFLFVGFFASSVNLIFISVERYLKVVHSVWSKKHLHKWMKYVAIACTWIGGLINEMAMVFQTSAVIDGVCYGYVMVKDPESRLALGIWVFLISYLLVLLMSIFCYGKILTVIRRQARVMAGHSDGGPRAAQTHAKQMQFNVIKTMIFVCAFYAVTWLPEKTFILLTSLDVNLHFVNNVYYVTVFLGFLYICTNLMIITLVRCLNVVNQLCLR